jgi:hypothetical protein
VVLNTKKEESSQFEQMKQIKDIIQKGEYPLSEQFMDVVRLSIKKLKQYPYVCVTAGSVRELKLPVFLIYYFCKTNTFEIFSKYDIDYLPKFTDDLYVNQPILLGQLDLNSSRESRKFKVIFGKSLLSGSENRKLEIDDVYLDKFINYKFKSFIKKNLVSIYKDFLNDGEFPEIITKE